jgi:hypothetical protein
MKSDSSFCFKICLNLGRPRGAIWLEDTGSVGSLTRSVGLKWVWTHEIVQYRFVKWFVSSRWIWIRRLLRRVGRAHRARVSCRSPAVRCSTGIGRRWCSEASRRRWRGRRRAERRDELDCVILGVDCVLLRGGEATGDGAAEVRFGRQGCAQTAAGVREQRAWGGAPCRGESDRGE